MDSSLLQEGQEYLFKMKPRTVPGVVLYVLAAEGEVTAYGLCPVAALEALGRDGAELGFADCVRRMAEAAESAYVVKNGEPSPLVKTRKYDDDPPACFFCRETAELASAASGWPSPFRLWPPAA